MPDFNLSTGLPSHPASLADKEAALVSPLYRAINSVGAQLGALSGLVTYSSAEQAQIDQFTKLIDARTKKLFVKAFETLTYGTLVNLYLDAGKIIARKAYATDATKPAHGIVDVPLGIAANTFGEIVFMSGRCSGLTGTVFGSQYYLSTAGQAQLAKPTAVGSIVQPVCIGLGSAGVYLSIAPIEPDIAAALPRFLVSTAETSSVDAFSVPVTILPGGTPGTWTAKLITRTLTYSDATTETFSYVV